MVLPSEPLERIRRGMAVVDTAGRRLGKVARVEMATPPVTHPPDSDILDEMTDVLPSPPELSETAAGLDVVGTSPMGHDPANLPEDLADEQRAHLEEVGFLEVDGQDLSDVERFIAADHIQSVEADRVVVRLPR